MSIKGIDISSYQHGGAIDFDKVKADGYDFVIVKATEGVDYTNPYVAKDLHAAKRAGLAVGVYHFFRPEHDAISQANHFLKVVADAEVHIDLPYVIDVETNDGLDNDTVHRRLDRARTVIRQHGKLTATYSYGYFLDAVVPNDCHFCASDPLWLAAYQASLPPAPKPWGKVKIWQNSSTAIVPGIKGKVDHDIFQGDKNAWEELIGKRKPAAKLPAWYHRILEFPPSKLKDPGHTVVRSGVRYQEGDDVKAVQRKLGIKQDGLYGPTTAAHVKGFQRLHKLNVDGIVGPATAKALG